MHNNYVKTECTLEFNQKATLQQMDVQISEGLL